MSNIRAISLSHRIKILGINCVIAYIAFILSNFRFLPTGGLESVWLLSIIAYWFLALVSSPWFQPPKDILTNAVAVIAILVTIDLSNVFGFKDGLEIIRWVSVSYCVVLCCLSVAALFLHEKAPLDKNTLFAFRVCSVFGRAEILYTAPIMISVLGAYQIGFSVIGWLLTLWMFFAIAKPVEAICAAYEKWNYKASIQNEPACGNLIRIDHPNLIRVNISEGSVWENNSVYVLAKPDGTQEYVISLYSQIQDSEVVGTGICAGTVDELDENLSIGSIKKYCDQSILSDLLKRSSGTEDANLVGFSVENSTIGSLKLEVFPPAEMTEGEVLFFKRGDDVVYYQVLDAETTEETFNQNPRGACIVNAAQLGTFSVEDGFSKYRWLPEMNTPIFSAKGRSFVTPVLSPQEFILGCVPSTNMKIKANANDLVVYHTAILGATGTGKTELAFEIIRQSLARGIKVYCVDFTGDYRRRLSDLNPTYPTLTGEQVAELDRKIFEAETGNYGAGNEKRALKAALDQFKLAIEQQTDAFLQNEHSNLAILELAEITNTKASLRLTEMYLSSIMQWAKVNRNGKICMIVLEEAHTIVPEVAGSGFDYDTQWVVGRIGQIALQGRKYGVGLMLISQRTALVSKTILSQCSTFFTHTLIDQTSLTFLSNVYSEQHSRLIPNLPKYHFIAEGRALSVERPVVLKRELAPHSENQDTALSPSQEAGSIPA